MRYTCDPKKRAATLKARGLDFKDAQQVIESGATVTFEDKRFEYPEPRFITIGPLQGRLVVIVTEETENEIRIISMRKAEPHEKKIYYRDLR